MGISRHLVYSLVRCKPSSLHFSTFLVWGIFTLKSLQLFSLKKVACSVCFGSLPRCVVVKAGIHCNKMVIISFQIQRAGAEPNGRNGRVSTHVTHVNDVTMCASATGALMCVSLQTAFPLRAGGVDAHPDGL